MLERFDFDTYREVLRRLSQDRPCVGFPRALEMRGSAYCLIRHDVDFSVSSALRMAALEADLGLSATYFLLFSADYNLLAPQNSGLPRALVEMGHEVGLHYDSAAVAALAPDEAVELLRAEAALLGMLAGAPVRVIARHSPGFGGRDPMEGTEFINAYDPGFTTEITYISDSCGAWRDHAVEALSADELPSRVQLLIHPLFWDEDAADRWSRLEHLRLARLEELDAQVAAAQTIWSQHAGVLEHDRRGAQPATSPTASEILRDPR